MPEVAEQEDVDIDDPSYAPDWDLKEFNRFSGEPDEEDPEEEVAEPEAPEAPDVPVTAPPVVEPPIVTPEPTIPPEPAPEAPTQYGTWDIAKSGWDLHQVEFEAPPAGASDDVIRQYEEARQAFIEDVGEAEYTRLMGEYQRDKTRFQQESEEGYAQKAEASLPTFLAHVGDVEAELRDKHLGDDLDPDARAEISLYYRVQASKVIQEAQERDIKQLTDSGMSLSRARKLSASHTVTAPGLVEAAFRHAIASDIPGFIAKIKQAASVGKGTAPKAAPAAAPEVEPTPDPRATSPRPPVPSVSTGGGRAGSGGVVVGGGGAAAAKLQPWEMELCDGMNITPEAYLKAKAKRD